MLFLPVISLSVFAFDLIVHFILKVWKINKKIWMEKKGSKLYFPLSLVTVILTSCLTHRLTLSSSSVPRQHSSDSSPRSATITFALSNQKISQRRISLWDVCRCDALYKYNRLKLIEFRWHSQKKEIYQLSVFLWVPKVTEGRAVCTSCH